jgi:hypothetical protein
MRRKFSFPLVGTNFPAAGFGPTQALSTPKKAVAGASAGRPGTVSEQPDREQKAQTKIF